MMVVGGIKADPYRYKEVDQLDDMYVVDCAFVCQKLLSCYIVALTYLFSCCRLFVIVMQQAVRVTTSQ